MKQAYLLLSVPVLALTLSLPAFAQDSVTGIRGLNDRLEDIEDEVADDMDRSNDEARFGFPEYQPGFSGSASLGYSAQTGNTDTQDFALGIRMRFAQGQWVQTLGVAADFSETDGTNVNGGVKSGHWAAQNQASGETLSAMARALAT